MTRHAQVMAVVVALGVAQTSAASLSPVVVELFESQGCSSCPPAEKVMDNLQREFGSSVLLLTYHVDYWDYLGWKDTFSGRPYTDRQKMYGEAFGQDSIYTPEMVIQGAAGFNGSDLGRARQEVSSYLVKNRLRFDLALAKKQAGSVEVAVQLPPALAREAHQLMAVVYADSGPIKVLKGENRGETMSGRFAVRQLAPMPAPMGGRSELSLALPDGAATPKVRVAVLVEGPSGAILAAETNHGL